MCVVIKLQMTSEELEQLLGSHLRVLRLRQNITQRNLAERANVAPGAVQNAESGRGATIRTLVRMLKVLGRTDWIDVLAPRVSVSPLQVLKSGSRRPRQRASTRRQRTALGPQGLPGVPGQPSLPTVQGLPGVPGTKAPDV